MTEKVLTFYLCDSLLGINVTLIKEINRNIEYTPVPGAKSYVEGLFNMRGQVVTLFDLTKLLGIEEADEQKKLSCIILKVPRDPDQVGFFIDRPGDVIDVNRDDCELPPANVGGVEGEYKNSVVKLDKELLIIIEPGRIFKSR
jgi:purine-binding chemotaxis protein CheW